GRVTAVELAELEAEPRPELVRGPPGRDVDRTAVRVASKQRTLRTAQHLDPLDLRHVCLEKAPRRLPDAVDVDADPGQASDVEVWRRDSAAGRIRDEIRHHDADVTSGLDADVLEVLGGEGLYGHGRLLQIGFPALGRDDDLFELGARGER